MMMRNENLSDKMNDALSYYGDVILADYSVWLRHAANRNDSTKTKEELDEQIRTFRDSISITFGKKYAKVIVGHSVHSFVVLSTDKNFNAGDILKAASWSAPAKNFARGTVLMTAGMMNVRWAGV